MPVCLLLQAELLAGTYPFLGRAKKICFFGKFGDFALT